MPSVCMCAQDDRGAGLPTAGTAKPGGYVPPSLRGRLGMGGEGGEAMQVRPGAQRRLGLLLRDSLGPLWRDGCGSLLQDRPPAGLPAFSPGRGSPAPSPRTACSSPSPACSCRLPPRAAQKRRDENSVRVTNLSEDVSEDDLYELFGAFGHVQRVFIAKDRETGGRAAALSARSMPSLPSTLGVERPAHAGHKALGRGCLRSADAGLDGLQHACLCSTRPARCARCAPAGESRGFAFINFTHRDEGQRAINKLNGFGYDNLILKVEWAAPREPRN